MKLLGAAILVICGLTNALLFADWTVRGPGILALSAALLVAASAFVGVLWLRLRNP